MLHITLLVMDLMSVHLAPSTVEQIDINLVSDLDGPLNFVLGAFAWESDGHNKFYTHTAAYNVMRSFDLHPVSDYFDGTSRYHY